MSDRRALCVGINEFENLPTGSWLYGCVNDARDTAALLRTEFGFGPRDVTVLTDKKATKKAIMAKLTSMVKLAEAGQIRHLVFTYSSHGTQVPDLNGDESDRADEALVAYDIRADGDAWDPATVIVDDELKVLFDRVPPEVLVEVFIDTCHSGTGLRAMDLLPGRRPKFLLPPTPVGLDALADRSVVALGDTSVRRRGRRAQAPVLFAACRASQTSADASFHGRSNGAFTYYLLQSFAEDAGASRADILKSVRAKLKKDRFDQIPQLEAPVTAKKARIGAPS